MQRRPHKPTPAFQSAKPGYLLGFAIGCLVSIPLSAANDALRTEHAILPRDARPAVVRLAGDLDAQHTANELIDALVEVSDTAPSMILLELGGDRARPDLLHSVLHAIAELETPTAAFLADRKDRRVGPGLLALALACDHAGVVPKTTIERAAGDTLTHLNPDITDWSIVNLDLRATARDLADRGPLPRLFYEATLAPRSSLWISRDSQGARTLSADAPANAPQLVERSSDGWSFEITAEDAAPLFGIALHRTPRAFLGSLGLRARPTTPIEIKSGLRDAHARCLDLVERVRSAVDQADAALDVRAGRAGTARIMPHEYHAAADAAEVLVTPSRDAIAEIAERTATYPEILQMRAPLNADAPTEIGGSSSSSLTAWRSAVRDLEYDLSNLDDRIATYRRR